MGLQCLKTKHLMCMRWKKSHWPPKDKKHIKELRTLCLHSAGWKRPCYVYALVSAESVSTYLNALVKSSIFWQLFLATVAPRFLFQLLLHLLPRFTKSTRPYSYILCSMLRLFRMCALYFTHPSPVLASLLLLHLSLLTNVTFFSGYKFY